VNELEKRPDNGDRDPSTGKFVVGNRGGPGRPRTNAQMRELFRAKTADAAAKLFQLANSEDAEIAFKATKECLDRGWGKTPLTASGDEDEDGGGGGKPRVTVHIDLGG
jgi:hypothetical protein